MSDTPSGSTPPAPPKLPQPRNGGNHMFMSPPNQFERDAWAVDRWREGWMFKDIGAALDITKSKAHNAVQRGLRGPRAAATEAAERGREVQRARLERAHEAAMEVLEAHHITVSHGKVITITDDQGDEVPLTDHGPVLQAVAAVVRISESYRKLDGLDAPAKTESTVTVAPQDIELARIIQQTEADNAAKEARIRGDVAP
jgi:hypothetical protein